MTTDTGAEPLPATGRSVGADLGIARFLTTSDGEVIAHPQFATILTAKAESAGRRVVFVNPAGTSITCHICGRERTRPRQKTVTCPTHGMIDADVNGARNVATRAGLGSGQASAA